MSLLLLRWLREGQKNQPLLWTEPAGNSLTFDASRSCRPGHRTLSVMQPSSDTISDVWFRSPAVLTEIVEVLGLSDASFDAEDYWEWAIGTLDGIQVDVTRTHQRPAASVDTRIFRLDRGAISNDLLTQLTRRLRTVARGPVSWGRWVYRKGNDFDLQVVGHTAGG